MIYDSSTQQVQDRRFKNKKVAVLGFGIEGQSAVRFLLSQNCILTVFDEKKETDFNPALIQTLKNQSVSFVFGDFGDLSGMDLIVRSPSVKLNHPELEKAKEKNIEITSATKIFFDLCPCRIIGVTGTKGKGTTCSLIYEMLKEQGLKVYLGGNIGNPPLDFISKLNPDSVVVLELSSFQLQDLTISPHIAVMLMTTSEHLDYHKDVYEYIDAKRNILKFQTKDDFAVINHDYPASNESDVLTPARVYYVSREQGVWQGTYIKNDAVWLKMGVASIEGFGEPREVEIIKTKDILLPGKHNLENVCAAILGATLAGAMQKAIVRVLKTFKGLEHRLELAATVQGVRYYDDSFSTTPETAIAAIEAFSDPEILILGGSSKNSDFTELGKIISSAKNIKAIIGVGVEWERIKSNIKNQRSNMLIFEGAKDMHAVVQAASKIATFGDVVLLSPACASFDMFKNYKVRGEEFKKEVSKLITNS